MNNHIKRLILLIMILLVLLFSSCGSIGALSKKNSDASVSTAKQNNATHEQAENTNSEDDISSDEFDGFYYNKLDDNQKKAYVKMIKAVKNHTDSVEVGSVDKDSLTEIFQAVSYDNPEICCLDNNFSWSSLFGKITLNLNFLYDKSECSSRTEELKKAKSKIIKGVNEDMDDFQKELYVHDYIIMNCQYKDQASGSNQYTAYGALVNGEAVCEGYARAVKYILDDLNIENRLIIGDARGSDDSIESHMWNIVRIDGEYYHLDPTWNAPVTGKGSGLRHIYFNLSDEEILKDHLNFDDLTYCGSMDSNYFARRGMLFEKIDEAAGTKIVKEIVKNEKKNIDSIEVAFTSESAYNNGVKTLIDKGKIYQYIRSANKSHKNVYKDKSINVSLDEKYRTILVIFERKQ